MDNNKLLFVVALLLGIIIGFIIAGIFFIIGIYEVGNSMQVENVSWNISIPINETRMLEALNENTQQRISSKGQV